MFRDFAAWTSVRVVLAALATCLAASSAVAEITTIEVDDFGPMGTFGGRNYTWVSATMEGVLRRDDGSVGSYRVPITLNYPDHDANGLGFVDFVNDAGFMFYTDETAGLGRPIAIYTGDLIFSDFLRREGYVYMSVQWYYPAVEALGSDQIWIDRPTDAHQIARDAADLLRGSGDLLDIVNVPLPGTEYVIAHGHSGSAGFLRGFIWGGYNRSPDGTLSYDGFFLTGHNGQRCRMLLDTAEDGQVAFTGPEYLEVVECLDLPADGKLITMRTQTDVEGPRVGNRVGTGTLERTYDVAGVPHVPEFISLLRYVGASRQNPVSWRPVAKALLSHLANWVTQGVEPPPPLHIQGEFDADNQFHVETDQDGNVIGGIRPPHMPSLLANGDPAGAPLGVYGGRDPELLGVTDAGFAVLGGTFTPFPPDEILRRYPTHEIYVELVRRAAAQLLEQGFILPEDYDAYVRTAERDKLYETSNP